jgi:hypothetical protein
MQERRSKGREQQARSWRWLLVPVCEATWQRLDRTIPLSQGVSVVAHRRKDQGVHWGYCGDAYSEWTEILFLIVILTCISALEHPFGSIATYLGVF